MSLITKVRNTSPGNPQPETVQFVPGGGTRLANGIGDTYNEIKNGACNYCKKL